MVDRALLFPRNPYPSDFSYILTAFKYPLLHLRTPTQPESKFTPVIPNVFHVPPGNLRSRTCNDSVGSLFTHNDQPPLRRKPRNATPLDASDHVAVANAPY